MSKYTDNYAAAAAANGLRYDETNRVIYGQKDGYDLLIYAEDKSYPYVMTIDTSARRSSGGLTKEESKELVKSCKGLTGVESDGNLVKAKMFLRAGAKQETLIETLRESISAFTTFLTNKGYTPCCSVCGQNVEVSGFKAGLSYMHLCPVCEGQMRNNVANVAEKQRVRDNVPAGIVGALVGSLLGVAVIILFGQMGYVAAVSGVVMAYACLKGYELLGKNLTIKGVVICVVIMAAMTYLGNRANWAFTAVRELSGQLGFSRYTFFDWFRELPGMLKEVGEAASYLETLALTYFFVLVGAVPIVWGRLKDRKASRSMIRIGYTGADGKL